MARRRSRPMGMWTQYIGRNWVIGTEPGAYQIATLEMRAVEARKRMAGPKPIRVTRTPIGARYRSECWRCMEKIEEGDPVHRARFLNGKERWVHADCSIAE